VEEGWPAGETPTLARTSPLIKRSVPAPPIREDSRADLIVPQAAFLNPQKDPKVALLAPMVRRVLPAAPTARRVPETAPQARTVSEAAPEALRFPRLAPPLLHSPEDALLE